MANRWTTVHPLPNRDTSFTYLPYWVHDIIRDSHHAGTDWRNYTGRWKLQIDTLKEAFSSFGDVTYIESRDGYIYNLSEFEVGPQPNPQPPIGPMLTPVPVLSVPPTITSNRGIGISGNPVIVSGGTGYVFGDILDVVGEGTVTGQLRVMAVSTGGVITTVQVKRGGAYTAALSGTRTVTGGTGTGATFTVTTNGSATGTIYAGVLIDRGDDDKLTWWGSDVKDVTSGYKGNGVGNGTQCRVTFKTDSPKVEFRVAGVNSKYDLYVDGSRVSGTSFTTDSSGDTFVYKVEFTDSVVREFSMVGINTAIGGITLDTGKTATKITRPATMVWQLGDSYTFGTMATQASFNDFRFYCDQLGWVGLADGIGGSGWTSDGSPLPAPQTRITSKLKTLTFKPDIITLALGYNDAPAGRIELLKTNFRESIALIKEAQPQAKIIAFGPATPLGMTPQIAAIRDAIIELTTELDIAFVDVKGWVTAENAHLYTSSDNVHPNDQGYFWRGSQFTNVLPDLVV